MPRQVLNQPKLGGCGLCTLLKPFSLYKARYRLACPACVLLCPDCVFRISARFQRARAFVGCAAHA
jgi:hypothetical protein